MCIVCYTWNCCVCHCRVLKSRALGRVGAGPCSAWCSRSSSLNQTDAASFLLRTVYTLTERNTMTFLIFCSVVLSGSQTELLTASSRCSISWFLSSSFWVTLSRALINIASLSRFRGSHASFKVVEFFSNFSRPVKCYKVVFCLDLEISGKHSWVSWI